MHFSRLLKDTSIFPVTTTRETKGSSVRKICPDDMTQPYTDFVVSNNAGGDEEVERLSIRPRTTTQYDLLYTSFVERKQEKSDDELSSV